ncbi:YcxB family protein [Caldifermentibacillus hisashii]|uniref:YcxB family protein n=1 Tax=Caldifermentibacillus hisashii TaxID=996558 RepID=UPI0031B79D01
MEIKYNVSEEDYLNFNKFHIGTSKTFKRALFVQRIIGPIIFIVFSFIFSKMGDISFLSLLIPFIILSILWFIFYPKYFYKSVIRNTKKVLKEGKVGGFLGEHMMALTDEGIVDSTATEQTKVSWAGIQSFKEDEHNLYLYNSSVSAYILPKKELKNVYEIRTYIKSKMKQ